MAKFGSIGLYSVKLTQFYFSYGSSQLSPRSSVWVSGVLLLRKGMKGEWEGMKGEKEVGRRGREETVTPFPSPMMPLIINTFTKM